MPGFPLCILIVVMPHPYPAGLGPISSIGLLQLWSVGMAQVIEKP